VTSSRDSVKPVGERRGSSKRRSRTTADTHCAACGAEFEPDAKMVIVESRCGTAAYHRNCVTCEDCGRKIGVLIFVVQVRSIPSLCCTGRCTREKILCSTCARPNSESRRGCLP
jgi:hypothetical protein